MHQRCYNVNNPQYKDYGGRGIFVCQRWHGRPQGFWNFVGDMGERPSGKTLDRKDNLRGYFPDNCKWSTKSEQQLNRRNTVKIQIEGIEYVAAILAKKHGLKTDTVVQRASIGLTFDAVVSKKRRVFTAGLALGGKASAEKKKAKTHCPQGHEYTHENIIYKKEGHRACKTCHREREAARRAKLCAE